MKALQEMVALSPIAHLITARTGFYVQCTYRPTIVVPGALGKALGKVVEGVVIIPP
ncbi:hypothetical protein NDI42_05000 [Funiculus sociatus GB2-C1]